jgi:hypothetical protein
MATTQEIIDSYVELLLLQYKNLPNASGMIASAVTPIIMDQLPLAVMNGFQLGPNAANPSNPQAVGVQLDTIGKYIGVTRSGLGIYQQPITLDDMDFTQLLILGIARNNLGSSLFNIDTFLQMFFPGEIYIYDGLDMFISYLVIGSVGSENLVQMMITQNLLPKPMGVGISSIVYLAVPGLFCFTAYTQWSLPLPLTFDIPAWDSSVTYTASQEVYSGGIVYSSKVSGNLNNAVTNPTFWTPIVFPMTTYNGYSNYLQTPAYTQSWHWLSYADTIVL